MANDVIDALYAALCAMKIASGLPRVDAEYDFGPAIASVEAALDARPLPEGMETTEEEWDRFCASAHEDSFIAHAKRDFDRLRARLAEAEAEKAAAVESAAILARAFEERVAARVAAEREEIIALCLERETIFDNRTGVPIGDCPKYEDGKEIAAAIRARGGDNG